MSPSDRLASIFAGASELPPDQRASYLDAACQGDPALRAEVQSLLAAHDQAGRFLTDPTLAPESIPPESIPPGSIPSPASLPTSLFPITPTSPTTTTATLGEGPGTRIGPYKLLQLIGEGGFGSVFMAEQDRPVRRKVALKIIKLGMDTRAVIARFEAERQALAMMDHANIARVLDAGATDTGRPFFVMELVKGDPIVEYCDKNSLSIQDRLELFAQVCHAVQHAHTKGIIHRDIKPSNILVSNQDGRPHTKVIDFGIAKATSAQLTEKTLFTEHKSLIGTPTYMSPEQAEGTLDIDTRTDVYSLGVLLYELLTGSTPFSGKELRSAAWGEMQRIIREVEPPKPSTRISQSTESITSVAAHRHTEPRRLGMIVRGELDWIVMKALEKDRQRRYETANGLAMDIRRYLSGEPVAAAPPSNAYRLKKLVKRNKGTVIAAGAVALALVIGLVGTIWQATIAADQRDKARTEAARAVAAEAETRKRANEVQRIADFQAAMLGQIDPSAAGIKLTQDVRSRFEAALARAATPAADREAQTQLFASLWSRVNATDAAIEFIDATILRPAVDAVDLQFKDQPLIAATLHQALGERYGDLGLYNTALSLERQALAARRKVLGNDHPDTLDAISNVGLLLMRLGQFDEAEPYYTEALDKGHRVLGDDHPDTLIFLSRTGHLHLAKSQPHDAERYFRQVLETRQKSLGKDDPLTLNALGDWATMLRDQGKLKEAEQFHRDVLASRRRVLGNDHRQTLISISDLAAVLHAQGDSQEAAKYFKEVADLRRRMLGETHPATLNAVQNLGTLLGSIGQPAKAESLMREALVKRQQTFGPDHPDTLITLGNLAAFLIAEDKFTDAEPLCRETLERRRRVLGPDHGDTLIANNVMGLVFIRQGKLTQGEPYWQEALRIARQTLGPAHPDTLVYAHNLASLAIDQDKFLEAEQLFREVVDNGWPAHGPTHPTVMSATRKLLSTLMRQKKYTEVIDFVTAKELEARKAFTADNQRFLAYFLRDLGSARTLTNQFPQAEPNLLEAQSIFLKTRGPSHPETLGCTEALADFYALWDKANPGQGHDVKAAEWKTTFDKLKAAADTKPKK
jgi:serine/threonine protein kinase/tetratricopeptide (TPR) repeat protein